MIKKIALLGSTGSIGTQTLQVIKDNKNLYKVQSLVAFSNTEILAQQAKEFDAQYFATIKNDGIECLEKAVAYLFGESFLHLQSTCKHFYQASYLTQPHHTPIGYISYMYLTKERQYVMFAH